MIMTTTEKHSQYVFQLNTGDAGKLCVDLLKLKCTALSPLAGTLNAYKSGTPSHTKDEGNLKAMASTPNISLALSILAAPDLLLDITVGGGMTGLGQISAIRASEFDPEKVVMFTRSSPNSFLIQMFDTVQGFISWNLDNIGTRVSLDPPTFLPETMAFEELIYTFHTIDSFRRVAYESMLEAKTLKEPYITVDRFIYTMKHTLKGGDIRWLLPTLVTLLPGCASVGINPEEEHLRFMTSNDLLITGRKKSTNEVVLTFGERGRQLSMDFYRTWQLSAGFELKLKGNDGQIKSTMAFMASTALANYCFDLEPKNKGGFSVKCSPLTTAGLASKLDLLLGYIAEKPLERSETGVISPEKAKCAKCGHLCDAEAAFCSKCGTSLVKTPEPPAKPKTMNEPKICPNCNKQLTAQARFCSGCGKPV